MTIWARIASSPPVKQKASATHSATSVIGGSAALFRSGQGRCKRPDVAVILRGEPQIEGQRHHRDDGGRGRRDRHQRIDPLFEIAGRRHVARAEDPQQAAAQRVGDGGGVGAERQQRAIVVSAAKPAIQSRMRPTGYHSSAGATGAAPLPADAAGDGPAEQREMAEPPGRQRDRDDKGDAIGQAEQRAEHRCAATMPPMAAPSGPQPSAATISGSGAR